MNMKLWTKELEALAMSGMAGATVGNLVRDVVQEYSAVAASGEAVEDTDILRELRSLQYQLGQCVERVSAELGMRTSKEV